MTRVRSPAPLAAGLAVVGFLIGGAIAISHSQPYRATTTLVVEVHGVPSGPTAGDAVPTIAALAVSDLVVENVAAAMHLDFFAVRSHLHGAVVPGTALIRIGYDDAAALRAQQLAQEASSALQAVVAARFGSRLTVAVVDPLRSSRLGRPWLRDLLFALLAAMIAGFAGELAVTLRRPRRAPAWSVPPAAPQPAVRAVVPRPEPEPEPEPVAEPEPLPEAEPVREPEPVPEPAGRVAELRLALSARRDEFDLDQVAVWEAYLDALEAQTVDGELPPALEGLALDVFEPLARARPLVD
jgi:hypothetical protein